MHLKVQEPLQMMHLQTSIPLVKAGGQIDYQSRVLCLGSCFAENMGDKLAYFQFQGIQNPLGILFHPLALERLIFRAVHQISYEDWEVFYANDRWQCFEAHSNLAAATKEDLLQNLNMALRTTATEVRQATHIILTLGTAWAYRWKEDGNLVANCHKLPQTHFDKVLLEPETITTSLLKLISLLRGENPQVKIILTISPVRHLKDGFVENQRSKAHLITALHRALEREREVDYFPAYEIMMDELRDYRFYGTDMVHPNPLGIAYIWEKFKYVWISESAYPVMEQVESIRKGLAHRPLLPESAGHRHFVAKQEHKIKELLAAYPFMKF